jgi:hypothetical protein
MEFPLSDEIIDRAVLEAAIVEPDLPLKLRGNFDFVLVVLPW